MITRTKYTKADHVRLLGTELCLDFEVLQAMSHNAHAKSALLDGWYLSHEPKMDISYPNRIRFKKVHLQTKFDIFTKLNEVDVSFHESKHTTKLAMKYIRAQIGIHHFLYFRDKNTYWHFFLIVAK